MPIISAERMQRRRDSILEAAAAVFSEFGFEGSSTAEIAQRAGISEGLIYKYFQNKRDLLLKVLEQFSDRMMEDQEVTVLATSGFAARLQLLISQQLQSLVEDTGLTRLYVSEVRASDLNTGQAREMTRRSRRLWSQITAEAAAAGELGPEFDERLAREAIWGAIEHLAWLHVTGRMRVDVKRSAVKLTRMLLSGLGAGE